MNLQLEALAMHCRSSKAVAELQLMLAWQLQTRFRELMPSCIVIPFGAPFSGHGTVSSDCDLCVLPKPDSLDVAMFSGPAYLPPDLLASWEQLQATPLPPASGQGNPNLQFRPSVVTPPPSYSPLTFHLCHTHLRYMYILYLQKESKAVRRSLGLSVC